MIHSLAMNTYQGFSKDEVPQFWQCWFLSQRCHMQLQIKLKL